MTLLLLSGCHQENDDLFATAVISIGTDEELTVTHVQAQAQFTNINTRQVTTTANFDGTLLRVELLRGPYQVSIEGVATCQDANGQTRHRQFRVHSDFVECYQPGVNTATLDITFLD